MPYWSKLNQRLCQGAPIIELLEQQALWVKEAGMAEDKDMPDFKEIIKPEPLRSLWPERVQIQ